MQGTAETGSRQAGWALLTPRAHAAGSRMGPQPPAHPHVLREASGEGRVLELPAGPALSLPSPGTSMCLQKEWKLGRLERRVQSRVGSGAEVLPFCPVGITPKR